MSEIGSIPPIQPAPPTGQGDTAAAAPQASPASASPTPTQSAPAPAAPQPAVPQAAQGGQGGQGSPATPQPSATAADAATRISDALRALASGGQFTAQVVAQDGATLLARTVAGTTLALNNLATALQQANITVLNAALRLQLNPENPQQANVVGVNGVALQAPLNALVQPPTAAQQALAVAPPQPPASAPPLLPQPGQTLTAQVLPPASAQPASAAPLATAVLPPGSRVQVVVQSVSLPAAAAPALATPPGIPALQAAAQQPGTPASTVAQTQTAPPAQALPGSLPASSASNPQSAPAQTPPASPSSGVPVSATINATPRAAATASSVIALTTSPQALPQQAAPQAFAATPVSAQPAAPQTNTLPAGALSANPTPAGLIGTQITGTVAGVVTGQSQSGQVLVSTPQGVLALALPQALPPGTQIALELAAITRPPTPTPTALTPAPLSGVLTRLQGEWPALQQTLEAVRAADPALAQRLETDLLPQPNARLAATALNFMAAAAAGNAQAWLGSEAVRKLEQKGRGDLVRKLDEDFKELGRLNQRQGGNDWQALVMPMLIGGRVEPVQIFMRRRRDPKKQQSQTRFIIDFNLESTGPIQFDGFVGSKQLDLILRSESEFGPAFKLDVTAIFTDALEVTGMVGSIRFRDREAPLAWPSPELEAAGPSTEIKA